MTDISDHVRAYMFSHANKSKLNFGGRGSQMRPTDEGLEAMLFAIENGYQEAVEADEGIDRITLRRTGKVLGPEVINIGAEDLFDFMERAGRLPTFRERDQGEGSFLFSDLVRALEERSSLQTAPSP